MDKIHIPTPITERVPYMFAPANIRLSVLDCWCPTFETLCQDIDAAITHPVFEQALNSTYTQEGPLHHALADARALRAGYRAWRPIMEKTWRAR